MRALFAFTQHISEGTVPYPYAAQGTPRLSRDYMRLICDGHKGQRFEWQNLIQDVGNSGTAAATIRRNYVEKAIRKVPIQRNFSVDVPNMSSQ